MTDAATAEAENERLRRALEMALEALDLLGEEDTPVRAGRLMEMAQ